MLVGFKENAAGSRRIVTLLEKMQRADVIQEQLTERNPTVFQWHLDQQLKAIKKFESGDQADWLNIRSARIKFDDDVSRALYEELLQVHADLQKLLKRYTWSPTASLNVISISYFTDYGTDGGEREWENWCVENLMEFHAAGVLPLFRRCRECQTWLFSLSEHQKYCGDACRQKFASKSSEFKAKRQAYMRAYRKREKELDEKSKKITKLRSPK